MKSEKKLTSETMDAIKNDASLMLKIAEHLGKKWRTVDKWAKTGYHKPFVSPAVMVLLTRHFKRTEDQLIRKSKKEIAV